MKLGLGTVQFGQEYGIANRDGRPAAAEVKRILERAARGGVRVLDTAALYGDSETVLGGLLGPDHPFDIITKTPAFAGDEITLDAARHLEETFMTSLERLAVPRVAGLLIHSVNDLKKPGGQRLVDAMIRLRERGLVARIGVSVYDARDLRFVLERFPIQLAQAPVNLLDRRIEETGIPELLDRHGVALHARSVFLQGALLMPPGELPPHFEPLRGHLVRLAAILTERGLSPLGACLAWVAALPWVETLLCGVASLAQLEEILDALAPPLPDSAFLAPFAWHDPAILDPRLWQQP